MADPNPDPDPDPDPSKDPDAPPNPAKTYTQAEAEGLVETRLIRERSKYKGYDDLVKKAEELEELKKAGQSDQEKAVTAAAKEADTKARADERTKSADRILRLEIKAAAAGKLADPNDAILLVDRDGLSVNDDGQVDEKAIAKRIDDLLTAKPYLAAASKDDDGKRRRPDLGQGRRDSQKATGKEQGQAEAQRRFGTAANTANNTK